MVSSHPGGLQSISDCTVDWKPDRRAANSLLTDTEFAEDASQQIIRRYRTDDLTQRKVRGT